MYVQILYHTTLYFYNKCIDFLALVCPYLAMLELKFTNKYIYIYVIKKV